MPSLLFLIFTYLTEALIVYTYAQSIYKPKRSKLLSFSLITLSYILLLIIYKFSLENDIVNTILILLANIVLIYFVFQSSLKSAIFHGIILCILQYISEVIALYLIALTLKVPSQIVVTEHFKTGTLISRVLYFMFSRFLAKLSLKENRSKSWGQWALLSLLPVSSIFIILVMRNLTDSKELSSYQNFICILSMFFMLIVNIIIYIIYEQAEKSSQKLMEIEIENQKNEIDMQYLELLEKKNEAMQIMVHDYKNHIQAINSMTSSPDIKEYLNAMLGEIHQYNRTGKTKNRLLDVIISKYIDICDKNNINFEIDIVSDNLAFIKNNDLSALFNNILDNAVEATVKSQKKYINLHITNTLNSYHKIIITNSCDDTPNSINGKLITTKDKKSVHGFGTKSILRIVNKYQGEMQWEYNDSANEFKVIILIPSEQ